MEILFISRVTNQSVFQNQVIERSACDINKYNYHNSVFSVVYKFVFYAVYDLLIMHKKFDTAVSKMFGFTSLIQTNSLI